MEQEYTLFNLDGVTPLGWPVAASRSPRAPAHGRRRGQVRRPRVSDAHYACLYAGLEVSGTNAEVMPGQWEYQIGPSVGIDAADQLTISRYILDRICEDLGVIVSIDPKPISGDWNGAGCHMNFSTESTRKAGGLKTIEEMCEKLGKKHQEHIAAYGEANEPPHGRLRDAADINTSAGRRRPAVPSACRATRPPRAAATSRTAARRRTSTRTSRRRCSSRRANQGPGGTENHTPPPEHFSRPLWCVRQNRVIL